MGGVYGWAAAAVIAGSALLAASRRPALLAEPYRRLDAALLLALGAMALQLLPLPRGLLAWLAPATIRTAEALRLGGSPAFMPLSLDLAGSLHAVGVAAAAVLVFWVTRETCRGGAAVRPIARGICWLGLLLAAGAILQDTAGMRQVYGIWTPEAEGARPFGPFVNRNHFATWMAMAIPLCCGHLLARLQAFRPALAPSGARRAADILQLGGWLGVALALMLIAVVLASSRSGLAGLLAGLTWAVLAARAQGRGVAPRWLLGAAAAAALILLLWADVPRLVVRIEQVPQGTADRLTVWQNTSPAIRDFWLTGSGAGTYETAMLIYQRADRAFYFNQAHNHYLHGALEGGMLVGLPVLLVMLAGLRLATERLRRDRSAIYWLRMGAAAGLVAIAVQSVWETGLRMPANALLAAVLAALLLHEPPGATRGEQET
jgi:putative inorganic carbon (hco3(-)) transporter